MSAAAIGFNVETVSYKNIKFQVWDLGGQTSIRPYWRCYYPNTQVGALRLPISLPATAVPCLCAGTHWRWLFLSETQCHSLPPGACTPPAQACTAGPLHRKPSYQHPKRMEGRCMYVSVVNPHDRSLCSLRAGSKASTCMRMVGGGL